MIPEARKNYHIEYIDPNFPAYTHYVGSGVYTGKIDELSTGSALYMFELATGELGSFEETFIKHEVKPGEKIKKRKKDMEQTTITKSELERLQEHSQMLGQIATYVEDFCEEEDSTLMGVIALLRDYHALKADVLSSEIARLTRVQD